MSRANQLADEVKALAKPFQSVIALGAYLEQIGSIEQAITEAQAAQSNAEASRDAAVTAARDADGVVAQAQSRIMAATTEAESILSNAVVDARATIDAASHEAGAIVAASRAQADAIQGQTSAASDLLADLQQQVAAKRLELGALEEKVAGVKASLASFIG